MLSWREGTLKGTGGTKIASIFACRIEGELYEIHVYEYYESRRTTTIGEGR